LAGIVGALAAVASERQGRSTEKPERVTDFEAALARETEARELLAKQLAELRRDYKKLWEEARRLETAVSELRRTKSEHVAFGPVEALVQRKGKAEHDGFLIAVSGILTPVRPRTWLLEILCDGKQMRAVRHSPGVGAPYDSVIAPVRKGESYELRAPSGPDGEDVGAAFESGEVLAWYVPLVVK